MKPNHDTIVDARSHRCPVPTLKLRRQLEAEGPGARVILYADDPMAQIDVPHFCNENGYIVENIEARGGHWVFQVVWAS